jgi:hypothetical protein
MDSLGDVQRSFASRPLFAEGALGRDLDALERRASVSMTPTHGGGGGGHAPMHQMIPPAAGAQPHIHGVHPGLAAPPGRFAMESYTAQQQYGLPPQIQRPAALHWLLQGGAAPGASPTDEVPLATQTPPTTIEGMVNTPRHGTPRHGTPRLGVSIYDDVEPADARRRQSPGASKARRRRHRGVAIEGGAGESSGSAAGAAWHADSSRSKTPPPTKQAASRKGAKEAAAAAAARDTMGESTARMGESTGSLLPMVADLPDGDAAPASEMTQAWLQRKLDDIESNINRSEVRRGLQRERLALGNELPPGAPVDGGTQAELGPRRSAAAAATSTADEETASSAAMAQKIAADRRARMMTGAIHPSNMTPPSFLLQPSDPVATKPRWDETSAAAAALQHSAASAAAHSPLATGQGQGTSPQRGVESINRSWASARESSPSGVAAGLADARQSVVAGLDNAQLRSEETLVRNFALKGSGADMDSGAVMSPLDAQADRRNVSGMEAQALAHVAAANRKSVAHSMTAPLGGYGSVLDGDGHAARDTIPSDDRWREAGLRSVLAEQGKASTGHNLSLRQWATDLPSDGARSAIIGRTPQKDQYSAKKKWQTVNFAVPASPKAARNNTGVTLPHDRLPGWPEGMAMPASQPGVISDKGGFPGDYSFINPHAPHETRDMLHDVAGRVLVNEDDLNALRSPGRPF